MADPQSSSVLKVHHLRPAPGSHTKKIRVGRGEASKGKTYSEVSGQYIAQCSDPAQAKGAACQQLSGLRQTMFMGDTLRGLLLYGYAFATIGTIAGYAAIAAFTPRSVAIQTSGSPSARSAM